VTLANAFTALLAAEQSTQPAGVPAAAAISEASIEDAVRRVLVRMTDDLVRRIVLDTAERLIREEIERIKTNPE
jgi:GTP cyclohydrolase I